MPTNTTELFNSLNKWNMKPVKTEYTRLTMWRSTFYCILSEQKRTLYKSPFNQNFNNDTYVLIHSIDISINCRFVSYFLRCGKHFPIFYLVPNRFLSHSFLVFLFSTSNLNFWISEFLHQTYVNPKYIAMRSEPKFDWLNYSWTSFEHWQGHVHGL